MTKEAAIYNFFSSFGLTAYATTAVPEDAVFPYLTYTSVVGAWNDVNSITVNLWYYTTSEAIPNAKAQEISDRLGLGGKLIRCDDGGIWLKRGSPWCQPLKDEVNENIKRRYINITAEFLTVN